VRDIHLNIYRKLTVLLTVISGVFIVMLIGFMFYAGSKAASSIGQIIERECPMGAAACLEKLEKKVGKFRIIVVKEGEK